MLVTTFTINLSARTANPIEPKSTSQNEPTFKTTNSNNGFIGIDVMPLGSCTEIDCEDAVVSIECPNGTILEKTVEYAFHTYCATFFNLQVPGVYHASVTPANESLLSTSSYIILQFIYPEKTIPLFIYKEGDSVILGSSRSTLSQ